MFNFLKNAIFRGLVVLIPVVVLYVTIRELLQLMVALATPIADLFPAGTFDHQKETEIIAALLVVGTALLLGILASVKPSRLAGKWVEDRTLKSGTDPGRLPGRGPGRPGRASQEGLASHLR